MTDDVNVSQRYRELEAQEPPRALDDAILAAARRSARPWTQRWAVPLSLAAVIVLSVTVTLRIQHEQPDIEVPASQAVAPRSDEPAAEPSSPVAEAQLKLKPEVKIPRRKSAEQAAPSVAAAPAASEPKPFAADQAAASPSARSDGSRGAPSSMTGALAKRAERAEHAEAPANLQTLKQADTPERDLERIAALRGQGRHDEADRALAEFRKRFPNFRIPEAMRERVERR